MPLGSLLEPLVASWWPLGGLLGSLLGLLGASWEPLGASWAPLAILAIFENEFESILGRLGRLLGPSWAPKMAPKWDPKRAKIEGKIEHQKSILLRPSWERLGGILGRSRCPLEVTECTLPAVALAFLKNHLF